MELIAALAGGVFAAGIILVVAGLRQVPVRPSPRARRRVPKVATIPLALALGAAVTVFWLTGWPVAAFSAGAAVLLLPRVLSGREVARRIARLEAIETWIRQLADALSGSAGIEEALAISARNAPEPIAAEVAALARRLALRVPADSALRAFADELDDLVGDMAAASLILAAESRGRGLREVLLGLARTIGMDVSAQREVEAERSRHRTTARWVIGALLGYTGFALLNQQYVAPFGSFFGQLVLAAVAGLYAVTFWWIHRLGSAPETDRFLNEEAAG
ncbi:type II secretion system F family protein [Microbispora sp. RL4-1S]|uniref:Type II secretion system F family protein n=1 Tax=Microbispora oryzae TaxID=2806554 RepID=A0A940WKV2_9ACTN|nr:type II secretion system F family protein [Microbispora oryzae]MBP2707371.1 type II secretion system F family protein [Microbispora oryzae]